MVPMPSASSVALHLGTPSQRLTPTGASGDAETLSSPVVVAAG
jgi:hypothetical protein